MTNYHRNYNVDECEARRRRRRRARARRRRRRKILLFVLLILFLGTSGFAFYLYETNLVLEEIVVEAGREVDVSALLKKEDPKAYFTEDSDEIDIHTAGEYHVKVKTGLFEHPALVVVTDTEAPVLVPVEDIKLKLGQTISYRSYLSSSDNSSGEIEYDIDSSEVNLNKEGTYTVRVTAKDPSGNTDTISFKVTIYDSAYFEEDLWKITDPIIGRIITPEMTPKQKIDAIYRYVFEHCRYVSSSNNKDWIKSAVDGFTTGKGNCFTDTCMTRALLTRAGFKNMVIDRIKGDENDHYWNLVDIDDGHGWYHLDCINRGDGHKEWEIILFNDAQLKEVDKYIGDYHDYDRTKYPGIL